jgi:hypothetical protein
MHAQPRGMYRDLGLALTAIGFAASTANAQTVVIAPSTPPPPHVETIPPPPAAVDTWTLGLDRLGMELGPGQYIARPAPQATWVPGHWEQQGSQWVWVAGHWAS